MNTNYQQTPVYNPGNDFKKYPLGSATHNYPPQQLDHRYVAQNYGNFGVPAHGIAMGTSHPISTPSGTGPGFYFPNQQMPPNFILPPQANMMPGQNMMPLQNMAPAPTLATNPNMFPAQNMVPSQNMMQGAFVYPVHMLNTHQILFMCNPSASPHHPTYSPSQSLTPSEVPANMRIVQGKQLLGQSFPVIDETATRDSGSDSGHSTGYAISRSVSRSVEPTPARRIPPGFQGGTSKKPSKVDYASAAAKPTPRSKARTSPNRLKPRAKASTGPVRAFRETRRTLQAASSSFKQGKSKKYGFRSKQNMIDKVFDSLQVTYTARNILASTDEVLRGPDTIRLHVKKYRALQRIEEALDALDRQHDIIIARVSTPLSMKNQFQKKGFLVYVKVKEVSMVPRAQAILRKFDEFKKCEVALQSSQTANIAQARRSVSVGSPPPPKEMQEHPAPPGYVESPTEVKIGVWEEADLVGDIETLENQLESPIVGPIMIFQTSTDPFLVDNPTPPAPAFSEANESPRKLDILDFDDLDISPPCMMQKISIGEAA